MLNNLQTSYVSYSWGFVTAAQLNEIRHSPVRSLRRAKSRELFAFFDAIVVEGEDSI